MAISFEPQVHMTYPKGHVIRLMKFGDTGRNVTSLQVSSVFRLNCRYYIS